MAFAIIGAISAFFGVILGYWLARDKAAAVMTATAQGMRWADQLKAGKPVENPAPATPVPAPKEEDEQKLTPNLIRDWFEGEEEVG